MRQGQRKALIAAVTLIVVLAIVFAVHLLKTPPYADYKDGVYIGEAQGIRKHLKVQVALEGGYITQVEVVEHYEKGSDYYATPIIEIPAEIIRTQSPDVDAISGATLTSNGIMDAVRNALEQAKSDQPCG